MKLKLFLLTALSVTGLLFPINIFAEASTLSVRLGQPKSPTNQDNIKLTFVALDITNREIAVSCYKKGPSDGGFIQFDTVKNLIAGGNTDYCSVTNSILNSNGSYSFYVTATAGLDTVTSSTVIVDFNTSGPGTPESYSKEKLNDCDYKIKFKTANDGKTVKVELFRSDSNSISINTSDTIATKYIGPNTEGDFTNSVPTCGKNYYYALRAVDSSDNVSGITGDSFTTVIYESTTTGTTTTQGAIPVSGTSQVTGSNVVVADTTGTEEVSPTPSTTSDETLTPSVSPTPSVLGTQTSKWNNLKWLSLPLILIAVYFFYRSKKSA